MKTFEIIPHTADLEIIVHGKDYQDLFLNALIAMFQVIKPSADNCTYQNEILICSKLDKQQIIEIENEQLDLLLVDFLSEALYLSDINNEAYLNAKFLEFKENKIKAILEGITVNGFNIEIKAVTYNNLNIAKEDGHYKTNIVFDI